MPFLSRRGNDPAEVPALPYHPSSPEGLAARWVQWVAAAGPVADPLSDDTGEYAGRNQPDDVWFLGGSYGKRMERRCAVPAGRDLFVPAVTMWQWASEGPPLVLDEPYGSVTVDDVQLELQEIVTLEPFVVSGARLNGVNQRKRPIPMTVWGLWRLIPGLAPGAHEIHVRGGDRQGFDVDVTYRVVAGGTGPGYPLP
jgi:hypothetical protein